VNPIVVVARRASDHVRLTKPFQEAPDLAVVENLNQPAVVSAQCHANGRVQLTILYPVEPGLDPEAKFRPQRWARRASDHVRLTRSSRVERDRAEV
jgi:hypothetical protein